MMIKEWLSFQFENWKLITDIEIDYTLTTKSGNEILVITDNHKPKGLIKNYNYDNYNEIRNELKEEFEEMFNLRALELLDRNKKSNLKKIEQGYLYSGKYIVKCTWAISVTSQRIGWKEYKRLKK